MCFQRLLLFVLLPNVLNERRFFVLLCFLLLVAGDRREWKLQLVFVQHRRGHGDREGSDDDREWHRRQRRLRSRSTQLAPLWPDEGRLTWKSNNTPVHEKVFSFCLLLRDLLYGLWDIETLKVITAIPRRDLRRLNLKVYFLPKLCAIDWKVW